MAVGKAGQEKMGSPRVRRAAVGSIDPSAESGCGGVGVRVFRIALSSKLVSTEMAKLIWL
jgi:hypothetical protein